MKKIGISLHVYNEASRIQRSVASLINQNCDFICVISDNLSTDGTFEQIEAQIKNDPRFILIRQKSHVNQMLNFKSCVEILLDPLTEADYLMHFAADDQLLETSYLSRLQTAITSNPSINVLAPALKLVNAQSNAMKTVDLANESKINILRVLKLGLSKSDSGKFNFVSALMSKSAFRIWYDTYCMSSDFENQDVMSRAIKSEFVAMFRLVNIYPIHGCKDVTYVKEIHNRDGLVNRAKSGLKHESQVSKFQLLGHQLRSFAIPIRARFIAEKTLTKSENRLFVLFGVLYLCNHIFNLIFYFLERRRLFLNFKLKFLSRGM